MTLFIFKHGVFNHSLPTSYRTHRNVITGSLHPCWKTPLSFEKTTTTPFSLHQSWSCGVWLVSVKRTWLRSLVCICVIVSAGRFAVGASQAAWWMVVRRGVSIDTGCSVAEEQVRPAELEIPLKFSQIQGAAVGGWSAADPCPFGTCRPCC